MNNFTPSINNCLINETNLTCNETARFSCNVTDDNDVDMVFFGINHSTYEYQEVDILLGTTTFYRDIYFNGIFNVSTSQQYEFVVANATDVVGKVNETYLNLPFEYFCCEENWVEQWINSSCLTNDTRTAFKYYEDSNSCGTTTTLPPDNGTLNISSCNYCSEDLQDYNTTCDGTTYETYWLDLNEQICCNVTGLPSDCSIQSPPYDTNTTYNCTLLTIEFNCSYDSEPYLTERMNIVCTMPDADDYSCVVYVSKDVNTQIVLQSTPEFTSYEFTLLSIFTHKRLEGKEYFTPSNRILNAYYTNKHLETENEFIVTVECQSDNNTYKSQFYIEPQYRGLSRVTNRMLWVRENMVWVIILGIVFFIAITFIIWIFKKGLE